MILESLISILILTNPQATKLQEQFKEAQTLYDRENFADAQPSFERALATAIEKRDRAAEGYARRMLGQILNRTAQFSAARAQLELALTISHELSRHLEAGRVYNALGYTAWGMGNRPEARDFYRKAMAEFEAAGNLREKASSLYNVAFMMDQNDPGYDAASAQALAAAREAGNRLLEGQVLHHMGDHRFNTGDFAGALENYQAAVTSLELPGSKQALSRVFNSLGRLYRAHEQFDRAIEFYNRALKIQEEIGDLQGVIQSTNMIGVAHSMQRSSHKAREYYEKAVQLARQTGSPSLTYYHLNSLAGAYFELGDFRRAVDLWEEVVRGQSNWVGLASDGLARAYTKMGRLSEALGMADKAVETLRETGTREEWIWALEGRAHARGELGQKDKAIEDIREGLNLIEQMRGTLVPADFMKRGFGASYQELYDYAIDLSFQSGSYARALEIAEQARARAFLDLLATRQTTNVTTSAQTADARHVPADTARPAGIMTLRGGAADASSSGKGAKPALASLGSTSAYSWQEIRATAARMHSTIVAYWVGKENTFIWVVSPDGLIHAARVTAGADKIRRMIRDTWSGILPDGKRGHEEAWNLPTRGELIVAGPISKDAWRDLDRLLIQPIRRYLPRTAGSLLTIVPHGPLFQLSFAGLLDDRGQYLVERHAIHYAPAAALAEYTGKKEQRSSARHLVVADPANPPRMPDRKPLPPLPGSRREARAITDLLPRASTITLVGMDAREDKVRSLLEDRTVIHFATHGLVRDDQPFDSFLAVGSIDGTSAGDGRLTSAEIYDLTLHADLVFLSACRTGLGKISGDGVAGLTRAFLYAGSRSVVATLWDVADEPTVMLVSEFYRAWRKSKDKSQALRQAQLRVLASLRTGVVHVAGPVGTLTLPEHPAFWAGFTLQGQAK